MSFAYVPIYLDTTTERSISDPSTSQTETTTSAQSPSVVAAGNARDVAPRLPEINRSIHRIAASPNFTVKALIFFENDSVDDTVVRLRTLMNEATPVHVITRQNLSPCLAQISLRSLETQYGRTFNSTTLGVASRSRRKPWQHIEATPFSQQIPTPPG